MVVILFQIIAVIINIVIFIFTIRKLRYRLKTMHIVLFMYQVIYVLPIILEWIFGIQDYSYKYIGFQKALNDTNTNICYSIFVIITSISLFILSNKKNNTKDVTLVDIRDILKNFKINPKVYIIFFILMFLPLILALFSPSPSKYFNEYAYFQKYGSLVGETELWYHNKIMKVGGSVSLLSIIITKFFSKNNFTNNFIIYTAAIITGILNGKRTLFAFIVLGVLIVEILKSEKGKFPYKKIIFGSILIIVVFKSYGFIINKSLSNVSNIDELRLYFFRDIDVKFSIYALLNPQEYKILEFWGQSYLFNMLFYIPRNLWSGKPYPYDIYLTSAVLGYKSFNIISWNFQISFFGEALSNLGWLGIPISLLLLNKFIKISEKSNNLFIIMLCIFIVGFSFMNHFGSYKNIFVIWLILICKNKFINRKREKRYYKKFQNYDYSSMGDSCEL